MARNITQETQTQNYHNLQNSQPNISYDEKFNHQKQQISQLQSQLQSIQDNQLNINCLQNNITLPNQLSLHQLQELTIALENDITLITLLRYVLFSAKSQSNSYLSKLANKMKDNMNTITDNTLSQQTRLQASLIFISLIYKFYCQDFPAEDEQKFVVDFDINFTVTREECFGAKARQQILESYKRIRKINLELTDKLEIYIQTFGDISGAAKLVSIGKQTAENRTLEKSQKGNK
ncbi:hypothetical protein SS50377_23467 [Spironucleus salmonicida]|nr:hypothetical protein SS50377_23467 [Spironucleus salmonicida]